jgi:hypothetical protein
MARFDVHVLKRAMTDLKIWKVIDEEYKQYILSEANNFSSLSIEI